MSSLGPSYPDIDFNPSPIEHHMPQVYYTQDEQDLTTQRDRVSPSAIEYRGELQQPQQSKFTTEYSPLVTVEQHFDDQNNCSKIQNEQAHQPFIRTKISYETIIADILCIEIPYTLLVFVVLLSSKSGKEATTSNIANWYGAASMVRLSLRLRFGFVGILSDLLKSSCLLCFPSYLQPLQGVP